jgi:hypothetical protein
MKSIKIQCELMGMCRSHLTLGVNNDTRMITLVSEERCDTSRHVQSVVICEFHERQECGLVILMVVAVHVNILLKHLVSMLSLPVGFRVITRSEMQTDV